MAEKVSVQPDLLRWARHRVNLEVADFVDQFPRYAAWEAGDQLPTMRQLERFAKKTRTPLGFLFLAEPPVDKLPIPDFRTVRDQDVITPSPDLLETIHTIQQRQAWVRDFLIEDGAEPRAFVGSVTIQDDVASVATAIQGEVGLSAGWAAKERTWEAALVALVEHVEQAGVMVMMNGVVGNDTRRTLNVREFRGFVLCDQHAPVVFLNNRDAKAAKMFTLAHEIAHVWLGEEGVLNLDRTMPGTHAVEKFCNRVAAEVLVPSALFAQAWREVAKSNTRFDDLARRFKVSRIVAARRALDLKKITRDEFFRFYDQCRTPNHKGSGGDFYNTKHRNLGDRFTRLVYQAVRSERLMYRDAYRLTGLHGSSFDQYLAQFGGSA